MTRIFPHAGTHLEPVEIGEIELDDRDADVVSLVEDAQRRCTVVHSAHVEPRLAQADGQDPLFLRVRINDQDELSCRHAASSGHRRKSPRTATARRPCRGWART